MSPEELAKLENEIDALFLNDVKKSFPTLEGDNYKMKVGSYLKYREIRNAAKRNELAERKLEGAASDRGFSLEETIDGLDELIGTETRQ